MAGKAGLAKRWLHRSAHATAPPLTRSAACLDTRRWPRPASGVRQLRLPQTHSCQTTSRMLWGPCSATQICWPPRPAGLRRPCAGAAAGRGGLAAPHPPRRRTPLPEVRDVGKRYTHLQCGDFRDAMACLPCLVLFHSPLGPRSIQGRRCSQECRAFPVLYAVRHHALRQRRQSNPRSSRDIVRIASCVRRLHPDPHGPCLSPNRACRAAIHPRHHPRPRRRAATPPSHDPEPPPQHLPRPGRPPSPPHPAGLLPSPRAPPHPCIAPANRPPTYRRSCPGAPSHRDIPGCSRPFDKRDRRTVMRRRHAQRVALRKGASGARRIGAMGLTGSVSVSGRGGCWRGQGCSRRSSPARRVDKQGCGGEGTGRPIRRGDG